MTKKRALLLAASLCLLVAGLASLLVRVEIPSRPVRGIEALEELRSQGINVVFILVDTLRADRLGAYGYGRPTSPHLDELAASGVRFAHVESQSSWTKASMASQWTGIFPPRTAVLRYPDALPEAAHMPAEIFHEAGYATAGLWRNGWVAPNFGFSQGFDLYVRPTPNKENREMAEGRPGTRTLPGTDADVTNAAIEFLRAQRREKFLLYLHYMDVHQYVYDTVAADLQFGGSLSDAYDAALNWTDRNINEVVLEIERLGIFDHTIVVIAADHGEAFREHGIEGHARNLFSEVVEVPLVFLLPFRLSEPLVVQPVVRNVDIWPTLLDLAGLPPLEDADGISLVPQILAAGRGEQLPSPPAIAYLDQTWGQMHKEPSPLAAICDQEKRVILKPEEPEETLQVFDHTFDPGEHHNLRRRPPAWAGPLRQQLEASLARPPAWGATKEIEVDEMYLQQLRALGYVVK